MSRYYVVREPDAGDYLGGFLIFIILFGALLSVALYIGMIALLIFLGVGVAIGGVYALVVYIKALISSWRALSSIRGRSGFHTFLLKIWHLEKMTVVTSFKNNFFNAKRAVANSRRYRFLSFRKWMWLIVAPATLIIGTLIMLLVILAQLGVLIWLLYIFFIALLVAFLISTVLSMVYSFVIMSKNIYCYFLGYNPFKEIDFSRTFNFSKLARFSTNYFCLMGANYKNLYQECKYMILSNIGEAGGYTIINYKKYLLLASPVAVVLTSLLYAIVLTLVLGVSFVPLIIAETFWALFTTIFFKS